MKRYLLIALLAAFSITMLTGCAFVSMGGTTMASLYTDTKAPLPYASYYGPTTGSSLKVGEASFTSFLGLVAIGDASIEAAMKNGGITKVHHIDQKVKNILNLIATYTVIVYGE